MSNIYQIGQSIEINNRQIDIFPDRIINNMLNKHDDEFIFAAIGQFIFVASHKSFKKNTKKQYYGGFWHTLFINKVFDNYQDKCCYSLVDDNGDGHYIYFDSISVSTGVIINGVINNTYDNNQQVALESFKGWTYFNVLTPKRIKINALALTRKISISTLLLILLLIIIGQYTLKYNLKNEGQSKKILNQLSFRVNTLNQQTKRKSQKTNYNINQYLPNLKIISIDNYWSGKIDFSKKKAKLMSNIKVPEHHPLNHNIIRLDKQTWLLKL